MKKSLGYAVTLKVGSHRTREHGVCALEATAWLVGEGHTAYPQCVCPVVAGFVRTLNDGLPDDEMRTRLLAPLLHRLVGTRATPTVERCRGLLAAEWVVRALAPAGMEATGHLVEARQFRAPDPPGRGGRGGGGPRASSVRDSLDAGCGAVDRRAGRCGEVDAGGAERGRGGDRVDVLARRGRVCARREGGRADRGDARDRRVSLGPYSASWPI
jgi:hypothetical protein